LWCAERILTSIGELASVAGNLMVGGPAAFKTRPDPFAAEAGSQRDVRQVRCHVGTRDRHRDFAERRRDRCSRHLSTNPSIAENNFVALDDPMNMFAVHNITPIVDNASNNSTNSSTVSAVSAKLETTILPRLPNISGRQNVDGVAKAWLASVVG
jgi:osmoprotectant transport system substrate-binding protein